MQYFLKLAGLTFHIDSARSLYAGDEFEHYLSEEEKNVDVKIEISWDWKDAEKPKSLPAGKDFIQIHYQDPEYGYCEVTGGERGAVARTRYNYDFSQIKCTINTVDFSVPQNKFMQILRMMPLRRIFLSHEILFLHAAQIEYKEKAVLFMGPSGSGKTTQAKLWKQYRGAEIVCNDRTLMRKKENEWYTYGCPFDGSEPVYSGKICRGACIVIVEKAEKNEVKRVSAGKAIARLMGQMIIDVWDSRELQKASEILAQLICDIPVYLLSCTKDEEAVRVLDDYLMEEGVL